MFYMVYCFPFFFGIILPLALIGVIAWTICEKQRQERRMREMERRMRQLRMRLRKAEQLS